MLKSMTGYGASSLSENGLTINVEVRTLNSKFLDLNLRLPKAFTSKELEVRGAVTDCLERGKVSLSIEYSDDSEVEVKQTYNEALFEQYYQQLNKLASKVGATEQDIFKLALNSPDVMVTTQSETVSEAKWQTVDKLIREALDQCNAFREKEGAALQHKFSDYITVINTQLEAVKQLDPQRIERIRGRIQHNLTQFVEEEALDKNRLEQELIYYIEKLDITEEKVRLKNHLNHFSEVLNSGKSHGKKLGFISQEIGREINTIGSKANDSDIQRHVVVMKEELEKIKEQLLNVL